MERSGGGLKEGEREGGNGQKKGESSRGSDVDVVEARAFPSVISGYSRKVVRAFIKFSRSIAPITWRYLPNVIPRVSSTSCFPILL